jgi:hypothetical protein
MDDVEEEPVPSEVELPDGRTVAYLPMGPIPRDEVERAVLFGDPDAAVDAIIRASLDDDDREWIEHMCWVASRTDDARVRLVASLALSHTSRRFGELSDLSFELLEQASREDESHQMYREDVRFYTGRS